MPQIRDDMDLPSLPPLEHCLYDLETENENVRESVNLVASDGLISNSTERTTQVSGTFARKRSRPAEWLYQRVWKIEI